MIIPIIYPTAASIWRNNRLSEHLLAQVSSGEKNRTLSGTFSFRMDPRILDVLTKDLYIEKPIHLMAPTDSSRVSNSCVSCKVTPKNLPEQSFIELIRYKEQSTDELVFVVAASPELCFLQAASTLSILDLIRFGYELCSNFFYDRTQKYGFSYHTALTDCHRISDFLIRARGMRGVKKARQALQYVHGSARSPMEILQSMIVNLPISYGGFAIKGFSLNDEIILSEEGRNIFGLPSCHCDVVWKEKKIALEYDSDQVHMNPSQHSIDKTRSTALMASGYQVFTLTTSDMYSISKIESVMFLLRKKLGLKDENKQFQLFKAKRIELLKWVMKQMTIAVGKDSLE